MEPSVNLPADQVALYKLIIENNRKQTLEIKSDIKKLLDKNNTADKEISSLKLKCLSFERSVRKNNLLIFGIKKPNQTTNILEYILDQLNNILSTNITKNDINNYYFVGKERSGSRPLILQFISFLKKKTVFENKETLKNLKTQGLSIANDLCPEDRRTQQVLYKHLKIARSQGLEAKVIGQKILIDGQEYQVEDLEKIEKNSVQENCDSLTESSEEEENIADDIISETKSENDSPKSEIKQPLVESNTILKKPKRRRTYKYSPKNTRSKK